MIVYASRTGNVRYVVGQLGVDAIEMTESLIVNKPFVLFTYTDGLGSVPLVTEKFMLTNGIHCKGIIVSGNQNFGHTMFGGAGDILASKYNVPLIAKLDLRGNSKDYEQILSCYQLIFTDK